MGASKSLSFLLKFGSFVFVVMFCVVCRQGGLWVFLCVFIINATAMDIWLSVYEFCVSMVYLSVTCNCSLNYFLVSGSGDFLWCLCAGIAFTVCSSWQWDLCFQISFRIGHFRTSLSFTLFVEFVPFALLKCH